MQQQKARKVSQIQPVKNFELFALALKNWASFQLTKKSFEKLTFESASKIIMKDDILNAAGTLVSTLLYYGDLSQQQKNIIGRGKMLLTSIMISAMKQEVLTSCTEFDSAVEVAANELTQLIELIVSTFVKLNFSCDLQILNFHLKSFREKYKNFSSIFIKWKDIDKSISLAQLKSQSAELNSFEGTLSTKFQYDQVSELVGLADKYNKIIKTRIDQFNGRLDSGSQHPFKGFVRKDDNIDFITRKKLKMSVNDVEIEYDPVLVHEFIFNPKASAVSKNSHFLQNLNHRYLQKPYKIDTSYYYSNVLSNDNYNIDVFYEIVQNFRSLIQKCIPDLKENSDHTDMYESIARKTNIQNKIEVNNFLNPSYVKFNIMASNIDIKSIFLYVIDKIYQVSAPIRDIETKTIEIEIKGVIKQGDINFNKKYLEISLKILKLLENVYFDLIGFYLESSSKFSEIQDVFSTQKSNFLIEKERMCFEHKYKIDSLTFNKELFIKNIESSIPNTVKWLRSVKSSLISRDSTSNLLFLLPNSTNSEISESPSSNISSLTPFKHLDNESIFKLSICSLIFEFNDASAVETLSLDQSRLKEIKFNINLIISVACILPLVEGYFEKKLLSKKKKVSDLLDSILCYNYNSNNGYGLDTKTHNDNISEKLQIENELIENLKLMLFDSIKENRNALKSKSVKPKEKSEKSSITQFVIPSSSQNNSPINKNLICNYNFEHNNSEKLLIPRSMPTEPLITECTSILDSQIQSQPKRQYIACLDDFYKDDIEEKEWLLQVKKVEKLLQACRVAFSHESPMYKLLKKRLFQHIQEFLVCGAHKDTPNGFNILETYISQTSNLLLYFAKLNYSIYSKIYTAIL
ncbi:hypothetical protein BB561_003559 [Smittium simulii]|uniref:Uncharacterized protein n=1 Tax=Smittium simulii TaxID=133385 RepID=A0A2T9YKN3_9FUNG|nr:hypothetical protein BB561_003559 [Smittium simulii]